MFSFAWAAIGILGYCNWLLWRKIDRIQSSMTARVSIRDEWVMLKLLSAVHGDAYSSQLNSHGMPDKLRYPWLHMYYELHDDGEFLRDINDDSPFLSVDYDELAKYNRSQWKDFTNEVRNS